MKHLSLATFLVSAVSMLAASAVCAQTVRDLDIVVDVDRDGSAWITQEWDVNVVSGTEWYIPVGNLGPMRLDQLSVSENGESFRYIDPWNIDASLSAKAGKCGIVRKSDGVELCWGQGSLGDHRWTVRFHVTGLVQSLQDADAFNFMFVNRGMAAPPLHARVTIRPAFDGTPWTEENTAVWGFGHEGDIHIIDGMVVDETSEAMVSEGSVIIVVRFNQGMFEPTVSRDIPFQTMWDEAKRGSDYQDRSWLGMAALILCGLGMMIFVIIAKALGYKYRKTMFGKRKIIGWWRDAPLEGNLMAAAFVLAKGDRFSVTLVPTSQLIGALFLRWIMDGILSVEPDPKSSRRVQLRFHADHSSGDDVEEALFQMAREASGANLLLEKGEFEKWSEKNSGKMMAWPERVVSRGQSWFRGKGYLSRGQKTTSAGAVEACHVIEFKNFLNDFTLSKVRSAIEVGMWKDYLVYAQLFGIADKVSAQFKKLYPAEFEQLASQTGMDAGTFSRTVLWTNTLSTRSFSTASAKAARISGHGGHTSFGGGGGFSGGGFGGGSR